MKVHTYEKAFLAVGIVVLVTCGAALVYATVARGIHLPGVSGRIDPRRVYQTPPFDKPGLREVAPGRYEAVVVDGTWHGRIVLTPAMRAEGLAFFRSWMSCARSSME